MNTVSTRIHGYEVEVETYTDGGEDRSSCFITQRRNGATYSASLACLEGTGTLDWSDGNANASCELEVPHNVIDRIAEWATANGY